MIKEIIFGTRNPAKIAQIADALKPIGVKIVGLEDFKIIGEPEENGQTAAENARLKATFYANQTGQIVLTMDNALWLDPLPENLQPGTHVRRINGLINRPTDQDLLIYYENLVKQFGERINGHWEFAFCIANHGKIIAETVVDSKRIFVSRASEKIQVGYPLDSLQIDPDSGKYVSEMSDLERETFWQKNIGAQLCEFFKDTFNLS